MKGRNQMNDAMNETVAQLIDRQQSALGLDDDQVARAMGYDRGLVVRQFREGTMRVPVNKVEALAGALDLDPAIVFRCAVREQSPELMQVIDRVLGPVDLSLTERTLITHIRKVSAGRDSKPIIFDGAAVIALVSA